MVVDNRDYQVTKIGSDRQRKTGYGLFVFMSAAANRSPMPQVQGGKDIMNHSYEYFRLIELLNSNCSKRNGQALQLPVSISGDNYFRIELFS